ncbi:MAG: glycosyltransferase family 2 protein [Anaerolineales bacterium]|nr:glycosyltransferase family 2 protein [Anaerolineales bacterium]
MNDPDIAILIVSYNAAGVLPACLDSLPAGAAGLSSETIVVDNASTDDSVTVLRERYPQIRLFANPQNVGFAAANNQAAAAARARYLLLLNPDTVVRPGALRALVTCAEAHPQAGTLGPRLLNADGTPQRSCWRGFPGLGMALADALYLWKLPGLPLARGAEYRPSELTDTREVDHLLGAALLVSRALWEQLGGLDSSYFLFLEETDWCYRAQRAGRPSYFTPEAVIVHLGEHSMRQNPRRNLPQFYRSYCQFYRKHHTPGLIRRALLKAIIAAAAIVRLALWGWRRLRRPGAARAQARAMQAGYAQVLVQLPSF